MKLYVGGKYGDSDKIGRAIKILKSLGHTITHNWTKKHEGWTKKDECQADINGVMNADAIVIFMYDPKYAFKGSWTEIGIAIGSNKPIYFITDQKLIDSCMNVFLHADNIKICYSFTDVVMQIGIPNFTLGHNINDVLKESGVTDFFY